MTEHLSSQTIDLLTRKQLAPGDLLAATRHLASCLECRQRAGESSGAIGRGQRLRADLQLEASEPVHMDYERLEAFVDDSLTIKDREAVKRHFASCAACLKEATELESLRDNLKTYPAKLVTAASQKRQRNSWQRLGGLVLMRPARLAVLGTAFVLVAIVTALVIWRPSPQQLANDNSTPANSNGANQNQVAGANTNASNGNELGPGAGSEVANASPTESLIKQAMETQKLVTPAAIRDLTGKESTLLGSSESSDRFALTSPVATLVQSSRPTFRWQSLPGATSYSVAILDSNLDLIEQSSPAAKRSWTPLRQLKRNVVYIWQVTALKDGREITAPAAPAREARFKILSSEKAAVVARLSRELAGSHLKLGIVYARDGLLDDAERQFRAAIASGQDPAIARKLLQSARQMRR